MAKSLTPNILVLPPSRLLNEVMSNRGAEAIGRLGNVEWNRTGRLLTQPEIAARIRGVTAVLTSWATPVFNEEIMCAASDLKIIGHAAGSIKHFIPPSVFENGVKVTHASNTMAVAVAEWTLTVILMGLRRANLVDRAMQSGEKWPDYSSLTPSELFHKRVGVIGASHVGRRLIKLLQPFEVEVIVYDPYLSNTDADRLGVHKALKLDELMSTCDVITNHSPTTPETNGMLNARLWRMVKDNALFVNTARAASVDYDALLSELRTGRIIAALDVFNSEPLEIDSPFRKLPNVILSPHVAGGTLEGKLRFGETISEEFARFFAGERLHHEVTLEMLPTMA